jgi:hypothetical protein
MKRLLLIAIAFAGCKPDLGSPASFVAGLRILGVKTDPPEVTPGMPVKTDLLAVEPGGRVAAAAAWSLCLAHKPPAENNVVAHDCAVGGKDLMPLAETGPAITVTIPSNACSLNGPDAPPTKPGEPPLRARDADVTGGYYQPIGVRVGTMQGFVLERIGCNLPNVSLEVVKEFQGRYKANQNPVFTRLSANGVELAPGGMVAALTVSSGQTVTFEAAWTPESREIFPVYEVGRQAVVDHAEELTVSWFVTAGELDRDRTGTTEAETQSSIVNGWIAPPSAGPVHLWVVLRDNRGGLDFREYLVSVGS